MREGVPVEHTAHALPYTFNDLASVKDAMARAGDDLVLVKSSIYRHSRTVLQFERAQRHLRRRPP